MQLLVGPDDHQNGVLSRVVDHDQRHARASVRQRLHSAAINAAQLQRLERTLPKLIVSHAGNQRRGGSKLGQRHRGAGAFAAETHRQLASPQVLATQRHALCGNREVHIDAANHGHPRHIAHGGSLRRDRERGAMPPAPRSMQAATL